MQYINIHVSAIDSADFKCATPEQQGTWLCALRYACGQESGGTITGCRAWPERQWQTVLGVEKNIITQPCGLWNWEGDDLVLNFYPELAEKKLQKMRKGGRLGNLIRWHKDRSKKSPPDSPPDCLGDNTPDSPPESVKKSKEKEGKEKEGNAPARLITLEQAIAYIREAGDTIYTAAQIQLEWLYFDARRGPGGEWLTERGQVITDWRSALTRALMHRVVLDRQKNGGEKNPPGVWEITQRLAALRARIQNHPANPASAAYVGEPSQSEINDLTDLENQLRELEKKLRSE